MSQDHDPIRDKLAWQGESLAPPPGQFDRVRRRARARMWRHAAAPVVAAVAVASGTTAAVVSTSSDGHQSVTPIGGAATESPSPSLSPSESPSPSLSPSPSALPTATPTLSTTIDAYTWTSHTASGAGHGFAGSLSCPTETFCAASVRGAQRDQQHPGPAGLSVYDGTSWSPPTWVSAFDREAAGMTADWMSPQVACDSAAFCMAVAPNLSYVRWDGSRWSSAEQLPQKASGYQMTGLACASDAFCLVVSSSASAAGSAYQTWDGQRWSALQTLPDVSLEAVSCPDVGFCVTFGTEGSSEVALTWNDGSWSSPETLRAGPVMGMGGFPILSCPTTSFCMVVGGYHAAGDIYATWDGSKWSAERRHDTGLSSLGFTSVSCPTTSFCLVADSGSGANGSPDTFKGPLISVWRDGAWRSDYQESRDPAEPTVSCPAVTRCLAAGGNGATATYLIGSAR